VLDGDSAAKRGTAPNFRPMSIVAKWSPISATAEHLFLNATITVIIRPYWSTSWMWPIATDGVAWSVCYDQEPCNSG